jgi:hypothetical protein
MFDFYIIILVFGTFSAVVLGVGIVMKDPIVLGFACLMGVGTLVAATSISVTEPIKLPSEAECAALAARARAGDMAAIEGYRKITVPCSRVLKPTRPRVPATVQ